MAIALQLAELGRGQTAPNPLVGAVVVNAGRIVGQGAHLQAGGAHAERHALAMAADFARGATVYVTLEPCSHHGRTSPCADALITAGVARVVVAIEDPNPQVNGEGIRRLRAAGIEVQSGTLATLASRQNEAYLCWLSQRRPLVVWKCAATLDGRIAGTTGGGTVSGGAAHAAVQRLRSEHPAIAVGIGTVLADDPQLTVRAGHLPLAADLQPLRVVFDTRLRLPPSARLLSAPGRTLVVTAASDDAAQEQRAQRLAASGADILCVETGVNGQLSVSAALRLLAERGITSLLLEGGATLAGSFLRERAVDKVFYYLAPVLLGAGVPALAGTGLEEMADAVRLDIIATTTVGADLCVEAYVCNDNKEA